MLGPADLSFEWVHICYDEDASFAETYGFSGNQGKVNLEGIRILPRGRPSQTLLIFMHPTSTLQLLPVPRAAAACGAHVLCAASRYAKNDSALIMEKVLLDLGAYIAHAKRVWKYRKIVLVGWSGGGSLALFYQAQAERPDITYTPAGDPVNVANAGLTPADAVIFQAAHTSRARLLAESIDPSIRNEDDPDDRDPELDLYDPSNPNQPPYSEVFITRYREAQYARVRRITAWVKETLSTLQQRGTGEIERGFVTHRTLADPRYLDGTIEPSDRRTGWCYMGNPETVNSGPVGLARFSTLRSWLSQWSIDDSRADAVAAAQVVQVPLLVIENSADDAAPASHPREVFDASRSPDKSYHIIKGATHYYAGQPKELEEATRLVLDWLSSRGLTEG